MTRRQKRKIALIVLLLLLLSALLGYFLYYRATRKLTFNLRGGAASAVSPPQFLYAFSGTGVSRLQRPVGVLAYDAKVYVADAAKARITVFSEGGVLQRAIGTTETITPLYVARNPKNGNLYVSDRRKRAVLMFTTEGKYLGEFNPHLPKDQLPTFKTGGVQWAPIALAFGRDGTMYATEILNGHRLLIFDPSGKFKKSVGTVGIVLDAREAPNVFQFPNNIDVRGSEVYVADSNNRRIQVFDLDGNYKRLIVTQGLPRGVAFLSRFRRDDASSPVRLVVVDTLAHGGTIWTAKGEKVVNFGDKGVLDGQFSYPTDASVGSRNKIFVTDTANGRVQVWGWPEVVSPVPIPKVPNQWWWCLLPLLLLPLLLALRKRRFFATTDFVEQMIVLERTDIMPARRRRWITTAGEYERIRLLTQGDVDMGELFEPYEHSESDVRALMDRMELDREAAEIMTVGRRALVFCTESPEHRRLARLLEIDVVNAEEFIERFGPKPPGPGAGAGENPEGSS